MVRPLPLFGSGALLLVVALALPAALVRPTAEVLVFALLGVGAGLSVRRIGVVDLATGAAAGAGATAAVVGGLAPPIGLVLGVAAGAVTTAFVAALAARVGRVLGALASLAAGLAAVGLFAAAVGTSGVHGVPHLTGSARGDLVAVIVALVAAVGLVAAVDRRRVIARATVATRAPQLAASLALPPTFGAAGGGAIAGAVLGGGGVLGASIAGAVVPDAYGLALSAGLALAALAGGGHPLGGAVGAVIVFGPGVVAFGAVPLLVAAAGAIVLLALRPQGLLPHRGRQRRGAIAEPEDDVGDEEHERRGPAVRVIGVHLPAGEVSLEASPSEITAVFGPNGAGKSTLLAMISGAIDDAGRTELAGRRAPRGAVSRARLGIARSWQRPPDDVPLDDALTVATDGPAAVAAARAAAAILGEHADRPAGADLVRVASRRPTVALLDEPLADLPADRATALLAYLASRGTTVIVAEHRREVLPICDHVLHIGEIEAETESEPDGGGAW